MTARSVPESLVIEWPPSAADALHLRYVLAENPLFEYGLHFDADAPLHAHVVFFRLPQPFASCLDH